MYSDFETQVMGHLRSSEPTPSTYDFLLTWAYLIPFPRLTVISVENHKIFPPTSVYFVPRWRGSP